MLFRHVSLNLLQERDQRSLCAVALLRVLQDSVPCKEDEVGFVFLSLLCSQQLYDLR